MTENFYWNQKIFFYLQSLVGKSEFSDIFFIFLAKYLIFILIFFYLIFFAKLIWADHKIELKEFVIYFSGAIGAWLISKFIKFFVIAERPFSFFKIETLLQHSAIMNSFPSGHTTLAVALATYVYFYDSKLGWIFFIAAAGVSLGRITTGVHYPLDILIGWILGLIISSSTYYLMQKIYVSK